MSEASGAGHYLPDRLNLTSLARALDGCKGCDLYRDATQAVMGEGPAKASIVLVGEQPGDREDREGMPFVGPAGRLLDRALEAAGADAETLYKTNVVKHFRFEQRGKRRIHKTPGTTQIVACRPWLDAELSVVAPDGVILLGATAAKSLLGRSFKVSTQRGTKLPWPDEPDGDHEHPEWVLATVHPSAVLRSRERDAALRSFVADLSVAFGS